MAEPFLGEIRLFPFNVVPQGWARCQGQLLSIQQNTALFSLLGTYYGGNGVNDFALPDLRGRSPRGTGTRPGGDTTDIGQTGGTDSNTRVATPNLNNLTVGRGLSVTPGNPVAVATTAASNQPPYLVLHYCIAVQGIFPSRD